MVRKGSLSKIMVMRERLSWFQSCQRLRGICNQHSGCSMIAAGLQHAAGQLWQSSSNFSSTAVNSCYSHTVFGQQVCIRAHGSGVRMPLAAGCTCQYILDDDGCRYPGAEVPKHLADADLPGTYGFDPLRLGTDPEALKWCALCLWQSALPASAEAATETVCPL